MRRREYVLSGGLLVSCSGCIAANIQTQDDTVQNITDDTRVNTSVPDDSGIGADDDTGDDHETSDEETEDSYDVLSVDSFEDLEQWDIIGGSVEATSDPVATGNQSAFIHVEESDIRGALSYSFESPVDLRTFRPQLSMCTDKRILPWIRAYDTKGNRIDFRTKVQPELDFQYFDFGIDNFDGTPNLQEIIEVQINVFVGSDSTRKFFVDDFRFVECHTPGTVVIQFDDTLETDYTRALPILEEHDMVASTFINPGYLDRKVGGKERLSVEQLDRLHDAGWDICNHGMHHQNLSTLNAVEQENEIIGAYDWITDHGYSGAEYFAYPFAAYNQETLDIVSSYHTVAFDSGWPAIGRAANPWLIHRSNADPTADEALPNIKLAAEYGGITSIYYHELTKERQAEFRTIIETLATYRDEGKLIINPVRDVDTAFIDSTLF